jgi:hypothetical protein
MHEQLGPLPEPMYPAGSREVLGQDCFTMYQMHAYAAAAVAAERERCAQIVESMRPCGRGDCDDLAAAIRGDEQ